MGFSWLFYGYFLYAPVWILLYFAWARYVLAKERRKPAEEDLHPEQSPQSN